MEQPFETTFRLSLNPVRRSSRQNSAGVWLCGAGTPLPPTTASRTCRTLGQHLVKEQQLFIRHQQLLLIPSFHSLPTHAPAVHVSTPLGFPILQRVACSRRQN